MAKTARADLARLVTDGVEALSEAERNGRDRSNAEEEDHVIVQPLREAGVKGMEASSEWMREAGRQASVRQGPGTHWVEAAHAKGQRGEVVADESDGAILGEGNRRDAVKGLVGGGNDAKLLARRQLDV